MRSITRFYCCCWLLVAGCTSMNVAMMDTNAMKGKDIDGVLSDLRSRGYRCNEKKEIYVPEWKRKVGVVGCGQKDSSPICSNSYGISLTFNLEDSSVNTATKTEHANCF